MHARHQWVPSPDFGSLMRIRFVVFGTTALSISHRPLGSINALVKILVGLKYIGRTALGINGNWSSHPTPPVPMRQRAARRDLAIQVLMQKAYSRYKIRRIDKPDAPSLGVSGASEYAELRATSNIMLRVPAGPKPQAGQPALATHAGDASVGDTACTVSADSRLHPSRPRPPASRGGPPTGQVARTAGTEPGIGTPKTEIDLIGNRLARLRRETMP